MLPQIWVSSNSGRSWAQVTATPPYKGRQDGQLLITNSGALLVVAGDTGVNDPGNVKSAQQRCTLCLLRADGRSLTAACLSRCCVFSATSGPVWTVVTLVRLGSLHRLACSRSMLQPAC